MKKAFKFPLKPTDDQEQLLKQFAGGCRWVWNHMLAKNIAQHQLNNKFIFKNEMIVSLPLLKDEYNWLSELPSQSLQQRCIDLDKAMKMCFRSGFGFPHFKYKNDKSDTFRIQQTNNHIQISKKTIKIPKIGWVKWKYHTKIQGVLKSITVKQEGNNWYVICHCSLPDINQITECNEDDIVGIDVGLKTFAVTSDNKLFEITEPDLRQLKKAQRKLSRIDNKNKKKGIKKSKRRSKAKKKLNKLHVRIRNQRSDFHHRSSAAIAKQYKFAAMENLNIKGMMKNRNLADKIGKQGWRSYRDMCNYKLARNGGKVILVDRFYPSSKTCSGCGHKQDMPLNVRIFKCKSCRSEIDRDLNASINLKLWAISEINRAGSVRIYARGDTSDGQVEIPVVMCR